MLELFKSTWIKTGLVNFRIYIVWKSLSALHIDTSSRSQNVCIKCGENDYKRDTFTTKAKCCLCVTCVDETFNTELIPRSKVSHSYSPQRPSKWVTTFTRWSPSGPLELECRSEKLSRRLNPCLQRRKPAKMQMVFLKATKLTDPLCLRKPRP